MTASSTSDQLGSIVLAGGEGETPNLAPHCRLGRPKAKQYGAFVGMRTMALWDCLDHHSM